MNQDFQGFVQGPRRKQSPRRILPPFAHRRSETKSSRKELGELSQGDRRGSGPMLIVFGLVSGLAGLFWATVVAIGKEDIALIAILLIILGVVMLVAGIGFLIRH